MRHTPWSTACAAFCLSALPIACDRPEPAVTAARVAAAECDPTTSERRFVELVREATVLGAEPRYSHVRTMNNNAEERVIGAKIVFRPPEGVSPELMTRILECHGARALLGEVAAPAADPFWLPDAWVAIDVRSEHGNYAVLTETDTTGDNIHLAANAIAFAGRLGAQVATPDE